MHMFIFNFDKIFIAKLWGKIFTLLRRLNGKKKKGATFLKGFELFPNEFEISDIIFEYLLSAKLSTYIFLFNCMIILCSNYH